jgi:hypothetical protein
VVDERSEYPSNTWMMRSSTPLSRRCVAKRRLPDDLVPRRERKLGGDDRRSAAISLLKDFEQIVTGAGVEALEAEVIEKEEIGAAGEFDQARMATVASGGKPPEMEASEFWQDPRLIEAEKVIEYVPGPRWRPSLCCLGNRGCVALIRLTITPAAYAGIVATLPASVGFEHNSAPIGEFYVWLEPKYVDRLLRPGESYSDVILRVSKASS